jgi:hypothetical protein
MIEPIFHELKDAIKSQIAESGCHESVIESLRYTVMRAYHDALSDSMVDEGLCKKYEIAKENR